MTSTLKSNYRISLHWTGALFLGGVMVFLSTHRDLAELPHGPLLALGAAVLAMMALAAWVFLRVARSLGINVRELSFGPAGLYLPSSIHHTNGRRAGMVALAIPLTYIGVFLLTMPFLIREGGIEGTLVAWDWWSPSMIAARLSVIALALSSFHLLPLPPLSGALLLQGLLSLWTDEEKGKWIMCRSAQVIALALLVYSHAHPLAVVLCVYAVCVAEMRAPKTRSVFTGSPTAEPVPTTNTA